MSRIRYASLLIACLGFPLPVSVLGTHVKTRIRRTVGAKRRSVLLITIPVTLTPVATEAAPILPEDFGVLTQIADFDGLGLSEIFATPITFDGHVLDAQAAHSLRYNAASCFAGDCGSTRVGAERLSVVLALRRGRDGRGRGLRVPGQRRRPPGLGQPATRRRQRNARPALGRVECCRRLRGAHGRHAPRGPRARQVRGRVQRGGPGLRRHRLWNPDGGELGRRDGHQRRRDADRDDRRSHAPGTLPLAGARALRPFLGDPGGDHAAPGPGPRPRAPGRGASGGADLRVVPEAGAMLSLASGIALLRLLYRHRKARV